MRAIELNKTVSPEPLYIISGEDDYLRRLARDRVLALVDGIARDFNLVNFTYDPGDERRGADALFLAADTLPVMSDVRIVCWQSAMGKIPAAQEKLIKERLKAYIKRWDGRTVMLLVDEGEYFKEFYSLGERIDCSRLSAGELLGVVNNIISENGYNIEGDALRSLIERTDRYLSAINNELTKLYAYADGKKVDMIALNACIPEKTEYVVFEITNALSKGDNFSAIRAINAIMEKESNPTQILALLTNHYRRMFYAKISKLSDSDLAVKLKCKPYAVTMARQSGARYKPMELNRIMKELQELDYSAKSGAVAMNAVIDLALCSIIK